MPKSSTFLFIIITIFLFFSFVSYKLLYKNLSDNHLKSQEISFYQLQKETSVFLTKLLFSYSEKKDEILKKHKEVLEYLKTNSYDTPLDEIYKKINQNEENNPYNIYITDEKLIIRNTTVKSDFDFDLSFAKDIFDNHKKQNIIGVSPPIFEMYSQKMMTFSDMYLPNTNRVLQTSFTYYNLDDDLEELKNLVNHTSKILNLNAYIIFNDGYIGDFIFKNIESYKPSLEEIEDRIKIGRELFDSFKETSIYSKQYKDKTTFFLKEQSPIFDEAKIVYSIVFDDKEFNQELFILNASFLLITFLGVLTIFIIFKVREKESILSYKDKFIEHSIHEIKTPLSIITLNMQLKDEKTGSDKYSKKIHGALKTLKNSYEDMSFLHTKSKIKYEIQNFSLEEILKDRVKYFEIISQTQNRNIVLEILDDTFINISKIELERLIDNNISNAIKYSEVDSEIKIILQNNSLKFISIGEEIINKNIIFQKYIRENNFVGGHGIGLSIVKDICDKYGIKIEVISKNKQNIFIYKF